MNKLRTAAGFGLIEITMLIVVTGIIAGIAMQSMTVAVNDIRRAKTEREMESLSHAIVGDPSVLQDGQRADFGYVGDVGAFPASLNALYTNPGGLPTWDGPYVDVPFSQDTISYRLDEWGTAYAFTGGLTITSSGGGSTITKKIADASSDYLYNKLQGQITDKNDSVPGPVYKDSIRVVLTYPRGASGIVNTTVTPNASGEFTVDSLPAGRRLVRVVYTPTNDTTKRYVAIQPRHQNTPPLKVVLPVMLYSSSGTTQILRPNAPGYVDDLNNSGCGTDWQCVDDVSADENVSYVWTNDNNWNDETYQLTNAVGGTGIIDSIVVSIRVVAAGSGNNRIARTIIRTDGHSYDGSNIDLDPVTSYTTFSTTYATNPSTGSAWTWTQMDGLEAGVVLKKDSRCTQVYITVYSH